MEERKLKSKIPENGSEDLFREETYLVHAMHKMLDNLSIKREDDELDEQRELNEESGIYRLHNDNKNKMDNYLTDI